MCCHWLSVCHIMQVMVAESLDISRETYFAIVLDRSMQGPVLVGSPEGGVDIEEVAASRPERIFKVGLMELDQSDRSSCGFASSV